MKHQRLTIIALCTLIAARGAAAQDTRPTEPARAPTPTRIRLTMTDGSRLKADLLRVEEGRLMVRTTERISEEKAIEWTEVKRAEASRGKRRNPRRGFLWGAGIAVLPGMWLAACCEDPEPASTIIAGGMFVALLAGGLGAGVGALIKTDRWEEVPISSLGGASRPVKTENPLPAVSPDRQTGFSIGPTIDRGVQARFSISWR